MTDARPVVLVTGAGGFVGRHLVPVLAGEGWRVRRAVRTLSGSDDEVLIGSIGPATDAQAALAGVEAVLHLAARVHHPGEEDAGELYRAVNTEGTLQLARCAAAAGKLSPRRGSAGPASRPPGAARPLSGKCGRPRMRSRRHLLA